MKTTKENFGPYLTAADAVIGAGIITVLGVSAGLWLDSKLNTKPLFTIILLFVGMILGLARMVIKAAKANETLSSNEDSKSNK